MPLASLLVALAGLQASPGALPAEAIRVPEGFVAELLYSVPRETQGSWAALCFDGRGRAYASDPEGALYRITLEPAAAPRVERLELPLGEAQGLCWALDALYVVVNGVQRFQSGLYRASDADKDGELERVECLRAFEDRGEHGLRALTPGPDGLYVVAGGDVAPPTEALAKWGRSFLSVGRLPVAVQTLAPRHGAREPVGSGWIARTDETGKEWDLVAVGLCDPRDVAFWEFDYAQVLDSANHEELGLPWHVPARLLRLHERADYGFRPGSARWPTWFPDSTGAELELEHGSPTGMAWNLAFPEPYDRALFAGDARAGGIRAFHRDPGGGLRAEMFASGRPLAVADLERGPDRALYFVTGGRGVRSGLYRIRAVEPREREARGGSSTPLGASFVQWRARLAEEPRAAGSSLAAEERAIRNSTRSALESVPLETWSDWVASEPDARVRGELELALARVGPPEQVSALLARLAARPLGAYEPAARAELLLTLRTLELALLGADSLAPAASARLAETLLALFPSGEREVDQQLGVLLASLPEAGAAFVPRALARLVKPLDGADAFHWAFLLRGAQEGWTIPGVRKLFKWLRTADENFGGGRAVPDWLAALREDAVVRLGSAELADLGALVEPGLDPGVLHASARPFVRAWTRAELEGELARLAGARDLVRGQSLLGEALCLTCHRAEGRGSSLGPELHGLGGRMGPVDLLASLLEPSRDVPEEFRDTLITSVDERRLVGRVESADEEAVYLREKYGARRVLRIPRARIAAEELAPLSPMPEGLLDVLTLEEILDLLAYLLQAD